MEQGGWSQIEKSETMAHKTAGAPTGVIKDTTWTVMTRFSGIQGIM